MHNLAVTISVPPLLCFILATAPQLIAGWAPSPSREKSLHEEINLPVVFRAVAESKAPGRTVSAIERGRGRKSRYLEELGADTETQVHLLAVSTWQRVFSSRVALTLGNNVCQLPDTNVALLSNSSVSKTWERGKQSIMSCQKSSCQSCIFFLSVKTDCEWFLCCQRF